MLKNDTFFSSSNHFRYQHRPTVSVFVYEGRFEIPLAAALAHAQKAGVFLAGKRLPEALQEAQQAVALAPDSAGVNAQMDNVLDALGRRDQARPYYATAL